MTVGYGHGIAVTPLHLATGYATLFNGGIYRPATLLKVDRRHPPAKGVRVFTEDTSYRMPVVIAAIAFLLISYLVGNARFANYLGIPHILGVGDLTVLLLAVVGACLAFLWFNAPPAAVFMGRRRLRR